MKDLSQMTLEELWELFPIVLVEHKDSWEKDYFETEKNLRNILLKYNVRRISHIGSTAIKDIYAKDIIDILIETSNIVEVARILEENGFIIMSKSPKRISLNKGYTRDGYSDKVFHIHLHHEGDNDELYFRDYLNEHSEIAKEYEKMKLELAEKYMHDRDAYTEGKTTFVKKWSLEARKSYGKRY